jgi:phytoene/squalene synthetase
MEYDLSHNGFESFIVFLRYTEGAAIAPASIFTHLCGVRQQDNHCQPPAYDIRKTARHLAIFSYLVHIIRDFQKDTLANLVYFPSDLLSRFNLSFDDLREVAEQGVVPDGFRHLVSLYHGMADRYRLMARQIVDREFSDILPRYRLSLEIIYELYSQIFERISPADGHFGAEELNPTPEQISNRIQQTIDNFRP